MPNWKSYDSSVRLLSAILAAHPDFKLNYQEIAQCFGDKITRDSMEFRFRRIKADAKAIREARASGIDPMTLDMDNGLCKEISKRFGGDCTVSALENRFRRIKSDAKAINDALANGIDPMKIPTDSLNGKIGGKSEIAKYFEDCTPSAIDHRLRPIKKEALAMRAGIADKFGEDVTGKAVSTRFERIKKEPHWNLANSIAGNNAAGSGEANGATPVKAKATPKKKKPTLAMATENEDDEEEFEESKQTPKKSMLNKTQSGRIGKTPTPKKNGSFNAAIAVDSEDENALVKREASTNGYDHSFAMDDGLGGKGDIYNDVYGSEGDMI